MSTDFSVFVLKLCLFHAPRAKWSTFWMSGKVEKQNKLFSRFFSCHLSEAGNNCAKPACQFAFPHNTSVKSNTWTTPYNVFFGFQPQTPISLNLRLC